MIIQNLISITPLDPADVEHMQELSCAPVEDSSLSAEQVFATQPTVVNDARQNAMPPRFIP